MHLKIYKKILNLRLPFNQTIIINKFVIATGGGVAEGAG